jgi:hypothetical protein
MNILPADGADGEARKRAAHRLLEAHRERLILRARRALLIHLLAHDTGSIDDVRGAVPVPAGLNPKLFGTVPGPLALAGIIRAAGSRKTGRAVGHARPVTVWQIADRAAALAWLREHPEPTEPPADDSTDPFAI